MAFAIRPVLLYLLVSIAVVAQEAGRQQTEPRNCDIEVKYDRFEDETTELCGSLVSESVRQGLSAEIFGINGVAIYPGTVRRKPVRIELNIVNVQMQSGVAKPRFATTREMYLLTDSRRIVLPLRRSALPSIEVGLTAENVTVALTKPFVEALIVAKTVEGRLGSKEFRFDVAELRKFQVFLKDLLPLITPTAPPRRRK